MDASLSETGVDHHFSAILIFYCWHQEPFLNKMGSYTRFEMLPRVVPGKRPDRLRNLAERSRLKEQRNLSPVYRSSVSELCGTVQSCYPQGQMLQQKNI